VIRGREETENETMEEKKKRVRGRARQMKERTEIGKGKKRYVEEHERNGV
jgi:hypothetical protein